DPPAAMAASATMGTSTRSAVAAAAATQMQAPPHRCRARRGRAGAMASVVMIPCTLRALVVEADLVDQLARRLAVGRDRDQREPVGVEGAQLGDDRVDRRAFLHRV